MGGGKLSISICTHFESWSSKFVAELIFDWTNHGHSVVWVNDHTLLSAGDVCIYLSYDTLVDLNTLNKFSNNLVANSSNLPKGRGWSPLSWQILEGHSTITVTLFEANSEIDSGPVYIKQEIHLDGHELLPELQNTLSTVIYEMCKKFIANYPENVKDFSEQVGEPTYYEKRTSKDSELDINQTIKDQFNLLRIVDNDKYPAFFKIGKNTYIFKISKQD